MNDRKGIAAMRASWLFGLALMASGCTNGLAVRQAELARWVGQPETALVGTLGVPTRTYETGGMKLLTYENRRVEIVPGSPVYGPPGPFGYGGRFPPTAVNLACDTTFTIADGVVRTFSLRGNACG